MKIVRIIAVALAVFTASAFAQTYPSNDGYVTDEAGILTPEEEGQLEARIAQIQAELPSKPQIAIVIPRSLNGEAPVEYANNIGEQWGVGQEGIDNGVVILLAPNEREVFISPASGLQGVLTAGICGRIIDERAVPHLRRGREAWATALTQMVEGVYERILEEPASQLAAESRTVPPHLVFLFIGGIIAAFVGSMFGIRQGSAVGGAAGLILGGAIVPIAPLTILLWTVAGGIFGLFLSALVAAVKTGEWGGGVAESYSSGHVFSSGGDDSDSSSGGFGSFGGFGGGGGFTGGGAGRSF